LGSKSQGFVWAQREKTLCSRSQAFGVELQGRVAWTHWGSLHFSQVPLFALREGIWATRDFDGKGGEEKRYEMGSGSEKDRGVLLPQIYNLTAATGCVKMLHDNITCLLN